MTINPLSYPGGGTPLTGNAAVDTAALQWSIDQATGAADPATNTRAATDVVYWPKGDWLLNATINIKSVVGLHLYGEPWITRLVPTVSMASAIRIDGMAYSVISNIRIQPSGVAAGDPTVDTVLSYQWTPAVSRSTSGNRFERINILNTKFRIGVGIASEAGSDARQIDNTVWNEVKVSGLRDVSQASDSLYNTGYLIGRPGSGQGNVINHTFTDCDANFVDEGWGINNCTVTNLVRPRVGHVKTLARISGGFGLYVDGFRTEHVYRLLDHSGGTAPATIAFSNFVYENILDPAPDGAVFILGGAGSLRLSNGMVGNGGPAFVKTTTVQPAVISLNNIVAAYLQPGPGYDAIASQCFVQPYYLTPRRVHVISSGYVAMDGSGFMLNP